MEYPTRDGIAVPVWELSLPKSRYGRKEKYQNNHHNEWTSGAMARTAVTLALRDLNRHQYKLPIDVHEWLHDRYEPPAMPTESQAAKEVINAFDAGEQFKIRVAGRYELIDIPKDMIDGFVAKYSLVRVIDLAKNRK